MAFHPLQKPVLWYRTLFGIRKRVGGVVRILCFSIHESDSCFANLISDKWPVVTVQKLVSKANIQTHCFLVRFWSHRESIENKVQNSNLFICISVVDILVINLIINRSTPEIERNFALVHVNHEFSTGFLMSIRWLTFVIVTFILTVIVQEKY